MKDIKLQKIITYACATELLRFKNIPFDKALEMIEDHVCNNMDPCHVSSQVPSCLFFNDSERLNLIINLAKNLYRKMFIGNPNE